MSGYQGHQEYDDGYGHRGGNTDSYYQDDQQYYDHNGYDGHHEGHPEGHPEGHQDGHQEGQHDAHHQGGEGYYDES